MSAPFAIWTPKFDGDAPPNWKLGDYVAVEAPFADGFDELPKTNPQWNAGLKYQVPPEAIFDLQAWLSQGRANADKLPSGVAEALGPERDWADELALDCVKAYGMLGNSPELADVAELLRTRCRPIGNDITDEWLEAIVEEVVREQRNFGKLFAVDKLRAALREANHDHP